MENTNTSKKSDVKGSRFLYPDFQSSFSLNCNSLSEKLAFRNTLGRTVEIAAVLDFYDKEEKSK